MRKTLESYHNLVKEFDFKKNSPYSPKNFSFSSHKKVWWICSKGHEWLTSIGNRTYGNNCPHCSGRKSSKENNLKTLYPLIANEWHPTKNDKLKPEDVTKSSNKKVWWLCSKGHEWISNVHNRTHGNNCPSCSGRSATLENNLKTLYPLIANEWHPTKNDKLKPEDVTKSSNKKVWWLCSKGHEWTAIVANRTIRKNSCPKCFNIRRKLSY